MPILLEKMLTLLALPLGTAVGAGLLALAALAFDWRRSAAVLLALAIAWLWVWSTPFVTNVLSDPLTKPYPVRLAETLPAADAIVLLGGGVRPISGDMVYPDLTSSSDRIWHAARLYHAGKAPLIIVSGGNVWDGPQRQTQADAMRMLLNAFGVPDEAIVTEDRSRNTRQNAEFTAKIVGRDVKRMLLITSNVHMRRAEAAFRSAGLDVIPAVADYWYRSSYKPWPLRLLPRASTLSSNSWLLREHLGRLAYRLRGRS